MQEINFWEIIERVHAASNGDMRKKCQLVKSEIAALSKEDAVAFLQFFEQMMERAYSWALWGAAYVINGGCGDDTFIDFRSSLISRGQQNYKKAVLDPDSLADESYDEDAWFYEGYQYVIYDAIRKSIGNVPKRSPSGTRAPSGSPWDETNVRGNYPKLAAKFK